MSFTDLEKQVNRIEGRYDDDAENLLFEQTPFENPRAVSLRFWPWFIVDVMLIFLSIVGTLLAWSVLPKFRMDRAASIFRVFFASSKFQT